MVELRKEQLHFFEATYILFNVPTKNITSKYLTEVVTQNDRTNHNISVSEYL